MKGRIFIAWSGTNAIATAVQDRLAQEDYQPIVGGGGGGPNMVDMFVGAAVLRQIDQCSQAIFIMQKKRDGTISSNLMFELGYALARFNPRKIHVFYIDIPHNDPVIPSDIMGIWADFFDTTAGLDVADSIVEKFLRNQRIMIPENKMMVIDSYYTYRDQLRNYPEAPFCSEFELAQYVLFFGQAAYMFGDEQEATHILRKLSNVLMRENPGPELVQALRFSICYLDLFNRWKKEGELLYLSRDDYAALRHTLDGVAEVLKHWPENDFTLWFQVFLYDAINFILILHSYAPGIPAGNVRKMLDRSEEFARKCLAACDKLTKERTNTQCVLLYQAYMYRNLSTYYLRIQGADKDIYENLHFSYSRRLDLFNYSEMTDLNTRLRDTFEMEYFLALSELLGYVREELGPAVFNGFREDCQKYIQRLRENNQERGYFIEKIERHVASVKDIDVEEDY